MSNWHYHQVMNRKGKKILKGKARLNEWRKGTTKTLKILSKSAKQVVVLRDSPQYPRGDSGFVKCVRKNAKNPRKCGTTTKKALNASMWRVEREVAKKFKNVKTVDLSTPYCGGAGGFCNPVKSGYLAFRDDNHFAHTYMTRVMSNNLAPHIKAAFDRAAS